MAAPPRTGGVTWHPTRPFQKLQDGVEKMREPTRAMSGHAIVAFSLGDRINGTTLVSVDSSGVSFGSSIDTKTVATGTVVRSRDAACR